MAKGMCLLEAKASSHKNKIAMNKNIDYWLRLPVEICHKYALNIVASNDNKKNPYTFEGSNTILIEGLLIKVNWWIAKY